MIKRKYGIMIVIALVLALLGSLFLTKTQAQAVYKDSMKIEVLEWTARYNEKTSDWYGEYGVVIFYSDGTNITGLLPYVFSPKQTFLNVTDLYVTIVLLTDLGGLNRFYVSFNGEITTSTGSFSTIGNAEYPVTICLHLTNPAILQTIVPGINTLMLYNPMRQTPSPQWEFSRLYISRVEIFIEYEYEPVTESLSVGGFWIPVDKFSLFSPYVALTFTMILAVSVSVAYMKYRKKQ